MTSPVVTEGSKFRPETKVPIMPPAGRYPWVRAGRQTTAASRAPRLLYRGAYPLLRTLGEPSYEDRSFAG